MILCASVCFGCSAHNCENCSVLREYVRREQFICIHFDSNKKDSDLENHFASGL